MKSLKDTIKENYADDIDIEYINEDEIINESIIVTPTGDPTLDAMILGLSIFKLVVVVNFFTAFSSRPSDHLFDFPLPFEGTIHNLVRFFKDIRADQKGKKLLKQLLKDQDIIDFLELPDNKRTGKKWKELLQAKLSEDDYKWANAATRRLGDDEKYGSKTKYTFYDR
jgi:hypothetical protein